MQQGSTRSGHSPACGLAAQTQALDERAVARDVGLLEVLQQPAATADERQQARRLMSRAQELSRGGRVDEYELSPEELATFSKVGRDLLEEKRAREAND